MAERPAAIVFDLFGTLVFFDDTRLPPAPPGLGRAGATVPDLAQRLQRVRPDADVRDFVAVLERVGREMLARKRAEGIEIETSLRFRQALREIGVSESTAEEEGRAMAMTHMASLASAVVCPPDRGALLGELAERHRLALLSNFDHGPTARRILAEAGLDSFFESITISEEEGLRKPVAELFHRTCRRLGLPPRRCLYVGDTMVEDIHGATAAGLGAVRVGGSDGQFAPALARLEDVRDLPRWLADRDSVGG